MKQITILLTFSFLMASCGNNVKKLHPAKSDTAVTLALYSPQNLSVFKIDPVIRVIKDTFRLEKVDVSEDQVTSSKVWQRDTVYFIPVIDTAKDQNGLVVLDSVKKKPIVKLNYHQLPSFFMIQDFNKILR